MSTINVHLPNELQEFVKSRLGAGGFASESDYIVALVDAARRRRSQLEEALIEGVESGPAEEWAAGEFQQMRERLVRKKGE